MLPHRKQGRSSHSEGTPKKIHLCHSGAVPQPASRPAESVERPSPWGVSPPSETVSAIPASCVSNARAHSVSPDPQPVPSCRDCFKATACPPSNPCLDTLQVVPNSHNVKAAIPAKRTGKSMSRRTGQNGHIEKSGKWWVVRWWVDVQGKEKRGHPRAKICPVAGPGTQSKSARERRAREIINESGADTQEHFNRVVKQASGVLFMNQASIWLEQMTTRKRKPVASSTLENWECCLDKWLNPTLGDLPLSEVNNSALKQLVATMSAGGLSPKSINTYTQVVKMVVASAVDSEGEEIYPRKWNNDFIDMPLVDKESQNTPASLRR
jgi:hypothetical protein